MGIDEQVVRNHHGDGTRLAGLRDLESAADRAGNLGDVTHLDDFFTQRPEYSDLIDLVNLERPIFLAACHIPDHANHGNTVEQRFADARERVGDSRPRYDAHHAGLRGTRA